MTDSRPLSPIDPQPSTLAEATVRAAESQATAPQAADSADAQQPRLPVVPGYDVLDVLGRGGMGVVYKARDQRLPRFVALKMIRGGRCAGPDELDRFRREAETVALLQHPNIIQIYEVGEFDGLPYCALEFAACGSLSQRLAGAPQPPREAAALVAVLARALHAAHEKRVVHRDLKPSNILITEDGTPKVADFGLAKLLGEGSTLPTGAETRTGAAVGTPSYMAPEQAIGLKEVGPAVDVYALGAILYEMLTGRPPFKGDSAQQTMQQVCTVEPISPHRFNPQLRRDLEAVCLKCLEKSPSLRYASAAALADDLSAWLDGRPVTARPIGPLTRAARAARRHPSRVVVVLLLVAIAVGLAVWRRSLSDRDQLLREYQKRLAAGESVTLIGSASGLPAWEAHPLGEAICRASPQKDGGCVVVAERLALVELLPDPMREHYRFSAEVRHEVAELSTSTGYWSSKAGLYFHYGAHMCDLGTDHYFCGAYFSDCDPGPANGGATPPYFAHLALRRTREGSLDKPGSDLANAPMTPAAQVDGMMTPWRTVVVEVSPERIQFSWEDQPPVSIPREPLRRLFDMELNGRWDTRDYLPDLKPVFSARGGLGLLVESGRASFRNVVVRPLP